MSRRTVVLMEKNPEMIVGRYRIPPFARPPEFIILKDRGYKLDPSKSSKTQSVYVGCFAYVIKEAEDAEVL